MRLKTIQHSIVGRTLKAGQVYYASYEYIFNKAYKNAYKELAEIIGIDSCPIFATPVHNDSAIISSNIVPNKNNITLILDVPRSQLHIMEYYNWTDYLYYYDTEDQDEQEELAVIKDLLKKDMPLASIEGTPQVVLSRIEPEWVVEIKEHQKTESQNNKGVDTMYIKIVDKDNKPIGKVTFDNTITNEEFIRKVTLAHEKYPEAYIYLYDNSDRLIKTIKPKNVAKESTGYLAKLLKESDTLASFEITALITNFFMEEYGLRVNVMQDEQFSRFVVYMSKTRPNLPLDREEKNLSQDTITRALEKYLSKHMAREVAAFYDSGFNSYVVYINRPQQVAVAQEAVVDDFDKTGVPDVEDIEDNSNKILDSKFIWVFNVFDQDARELAVDLTHINDAIKVVRNNKNATYIVAYPYIDPKPEDKDVKPVFADNPGPIVVYNGEKARLDAKPEQPAEESTIAEAVEHPLKDWLQKGSKDQVEAYFGNTTPKDFTGWTDDELRILSNKMQNIDNRYNEPARKAGEPIPYPSAPMVYSMLQRMFKDRIQPGVVKAEPLRINLYDRVVAWLDQNIDVELEPSNVWPFVHEVITYMYEHDDWVKTASSFTNDGTIIIPRAKNRILDKLINNALSEFVPSPYAADKKKPVKKPKLREAVAESRLRDQKTRAVTTPLQGNKNLEILNSVIGQLSDGIWENSPRMNKYWENAEIAEIDGWINILVNSNIFDYSSGFRGMSDDEVRAWFANKIKQIIKIELNDGNLEGAWVRDNTAVSSYLGYDEEITVADAYKAYELLLGRDIAGRYSESLEDDMGYYDDDDASDDTIMDGLDGVSDGMTPEDIASKHGVSLDYLLEQLEIGIEVEFEHTSNEDIAYRIALDHLFEMPDYYEKLANIELSDMGKAEPEEMLDGPQVTPETTQALEEATAEYAKDLYYAVSDYFPDVSETGLSEEEIDKFPELAIKYIRKTFKNSEIRDILDSEDNTYLEEISEEVFDAVIEMLDGPQVTPETTQVSNIGTKVDYPQKRKSNSSKKQPKTAIKK